MAQDASLMMPAPPHKPGVPGRLSATHYKTLALAALGGALEFYDFIIFVYFTAVIGHQFFPPGMPDWLTQLQTLGIFAAGYLARPLGGIVMAHFGDLAGRKRMFALSVFLMAAPTLLIGLLPTYAVLGVGAPLALLALRLLQGAAIGGEVPGAWVFVSEHVPPGRVGLACGAMTAGLTVGILIGSLVATAVNVGLSPEQLNSWGWRVPFVLGGVFGFVAVYLRRWLAETPVFEALRAERALAQELPLKAVLRTHGSSVLLSMLATAVLTAAILVVILMTPTLMQKLFGLSAAVTLQANSGATIGLAIGCVLMGMAADRFGVGRVFAIGCAVLLVTAYALYLGVRSQPSLIVPLYAFTGLTVGVVGTVPALMVKAFPPAVRFSGISVSYNLAYAVFGGLTPLLVGLLVHAFGWAGPVHYVAVLCVVGIAVGVFAMSQQRMSTPLS